MAKKRKTMTKAVLLVFCAVTLIVSACTNPQTRGDQSGTITLSVPDANIWGEESSALQIMYDLYAKDHPDVKLKQIKTQDNAPALAAGNAPDLMLMDPFQAKESYKLNYIEPLDAYYEKHGYGEGMFGWAKNAYSIDNKVIGIPWNYEGILLVYNETLFNENGWKVPRNYDELVQVSKRIKDKGLIPFAWGTSNCAGCDNWWVTSIVNSVLGPDGTKQLFSGDKNWTDPEIAEALQRYSDFWNEGYLSDKKSHAVSQEDSQQLFATGKAAMRVDGTWSLASDLKTDFEIGYAPVPSWKKDGQPVIPLGVGGGLVMNAKSKHKDEVGELLSYFFKDEVKKTMAQHGIPEPVEADYSKWDMKPSVSGALELINKASQNKETGFVAWSYGSPSVVQVLENEIAGIYLKKVTVDEFLRKLQEKKDKDATDNNLFSLSNY